MSLLAVSLGDWFYTSRKVEKGGDGLVHPEGENSMAISGLAVKTPK